MARPYNKRQVITKSQSVCFQENRLIRFPNKAQRNEYICMLRPWDDYEDCDERLPDAEYMMLIEEMIRENGNEFVLQNGRQLIIKDYRTLILLKINFKTAIKRLNNEYK